jgi:hypothetical protein
MPVRLLTRKVLIKPVLVLTCVTICLETPNPEPVIVLPDATVNTLPAGIVSLPVVRFKLFVTETFLLRVTFASTTTTAAVTALSDAGKGVVVVA